MRARATDPQVTGEPGLRGHHHEILQLGRPGNPGLRDDHATTAEAHVVPDLYQVVEARAGADHGILQRTAIDRGIGADLHIVLEDHAPELRHGDEAGWA